MTATPTPATVSRLRSLWRSVLRNSNLSSSMTLVRNAHKQLQPAQKDRRGEAREGSMRGGVLSRYVDARRLSATKHMSLFQQVAKLSQFAFFQVPHRPCALCRARIMGHHKYGFIELPIEPMHELEDFLGGSLVEIAGGFVGDQNRRIGNDGARDRDPLFLPAGKLAWIMVHSLRQTDHAQRRFGMSPTLFLRQRRQDERQFDVLQGRKHGNEIVKLKDKTHVARAPYRQLGLVQFGDIGAGDEDSSRGGLIYPRYKIEKRSLAGAGRAHERDEFALLDIQINIAQDGNLEAVAL